MTPTEYGEYLADQEPELTDAEAEAVARLILAMNAQPRAA